MKMNKEANKISPDLKVFITTRESSCGESGEDLGRRAWITLEKDRGALCLSCADLDHLVFLPSGDTALTRRARKRYERQGLLVEDQALDQAESECLADGEARARRKERETERRAEMDRQYVQKFAKQIHELYPGCPEGVEVTKYDSLLAKGYNRSYARVQVEDTVNNILSKWEASKL